MMTVPHGLIAGRAVRPILMQGDCCVLHKRVDRSVTEQTRRLTTHALTTVLSGALDVTDDQGQVLHVLPGQTIFLPKGMYMISDRLSEPEGFEAVVSTFDDGLLHELIDLSGGTGSAASGAYVTVAGQRTRVFLENLLLLYREDGLTMKGMARLKVSECLMLLLSEPDGMQLREHLSAARLNRRPPLAEYMLRHYFLPLSIPDFAALTGRSLSTFRREFVTLFEMSPKQWLTEKRMVRAKQLLEQTDLTIAEICRATGHTNASHFTQAFRGHFGLSPSAMRKEKST